MRRADDTFASVLIDGLELSAWQSYSFSSDLFTPADAFSLTFGVGSSKSRDLLANIKALKANVRPGVLTKFYIDYQGKTALQGTGVSQVRDIGNSANEGTTFQLSGFDLAVLLTGSAAPLDLYENGSSLMDVARKAIAAWTDAPYSLTVNSDAVGARDLRIGAVGKKTNQSRLIQKRAESMGIPAASLSKKILDGIDNGTIDPGRLLSGLEDQSVSGESIGAITSAAQIYQLKVKEAATQAGETVWEFLDRHAKRLGLLMRMGPDGKLVFQTIDYKQPALYALERKTTARNHNNIISGGGRLDTTSVYSQVRVVGKAKSKNSARSKFDVSIADYSDDEYTLPYEKTLLVHDDSIRSVDNATKRAYRELAKTRQGAYVLTYNVRGHGSDGNVFAVDTMCSVNDEVEGVKDDFYVIGRTFTRDMQNGARTQLKLVPKGAIKLEAAA